MKSRTSFSKLTAFRKDIFRMAPIWALYTIGMILIMTETLSYNQQSHVAAMLPEIISSFGVVNLIYAGVCAVMLYGDLYNTRMCYSLHAFPQRREAWLLSHFAAAVSFSLIPNCLTTLLMMAKMGNQGYLALYWLLASELQFLFFFGVASVSAMLTGNRFAMLLMYAGLNFVALLLYWIVQTIYLPMLDGVLLNMNPYKLLCPAVQMFQYEYMEFERVVLGTESYSDVRYVYKGLTDGWGYLTVLGSTGLVLMGAATLLYRMRHLESAGDFVAFFKLKWGVCVAMTVCVGGVFAFVGEEMFGSSMVLWMIVGLVIGYFGGLMLLERRLKVFRTGSAIGFVTLVALLGISATLINADVFGIVRWVPEKEQVKSVTISNYKPDNSWNGDYYYSNKIDVTLEDPEDIQKIILAHQDILEHRSNSGAQHRITLSYTLNNGRVVKRSYLAPASGENYEIISGYFSTPELIMGYSDWAEYVNNISYMHVDGAEIPKEYREAFLTALRKDCENGQVTLKEITEPIFYVYLESYANGMEYTGRQLCVLKGAENTLALMREPEIVLGYSDVGQVLNQVSSIRASGAAVAAKHYEGLLEALLEDCINGNIQVFNDGTAVFDVEIILAGENGDIYRYLSIPVTAENTIDYCKEELLSN